MNSYDLEIENYSFQDLVDLFGISNKLTIEDLKKASRTAIMMHPDKSGLDCEVFLFFKAAYKLLKEVSVTINKTKVDCCKTIYDPTTETDCISTDLIHESINNKENFSKLFNRLFENVKQEALINDGYGDWMSQEIDNMPKISNKQQFDKEIFQKKREMGQLIKREEFKETINIENGNLIDKSEITGYQSDMFSDLKYDDVKHAYTETVIPYIEQEQRANTEEQLMRERDTMINMEFNPDDHNEIFKQKCDKNRETDISRAYRIVQEEQKIRDIYKKNASQFLSITEK
tara:strand:- start:2977 stop:3840 length:864 start_codon:yes stop_codon:yes gene_type:complete